MVASVSEPGRRTESRCSKGSKLGHFAWFCKSKRKIKEVTEEPAESNKVANLLGIMAVVLSPLEQGMARLRLESRDRDWYRLISSLIVETETETMTP